MPSSSALSIVALPRALSSSCLSFFSLFLVPSSLFVVVSCVCPPPLFALPPMLLRCELLGRDPLGLPSGRLDRAPLRIPSPACALRQLAYLLENRASSRSCSWRRRSLPWQVDACCDAFVRTPRAHAPPKSALSKAFCGRRLAGAGMALRLFPLRVFVHASCMRAVNLRFARNPLAIGAGVTRHGLGRDFAAKPSEEPSSGFGVCGVIGEEVLVLNICLVMIIVWPGTAYMTWGIHCPQVCIVLCDQ